MTSNLDPWLRHGGDQAFRTHVPLSWGIGRTSWTEHPTDGSRVMTALLGGADPTTDLLGQVALTCDPEPVG